MVEEQWLFLCDGNQETNVYTIEITITSFKEFLSPDLSEASDMLLCPVKYFKVLFLQD